MKTTAAKIKTQVCSAKKPIACPAVLNRKLTIKPINPGKIEPTLEPMSFRLFPIVLPVSFRALVRTPTTVPIVTPAARRIAVNVTPFSLKTSLTRSAKGQSSFSFLNLSSQTRELPVSLLYFSLPLRLLCLRARCFHLG